MVTVNNALTFARTTDSPNLLAVCVPPQSPTLVDRFDFLSKDRFDFVAGNEGFRGKCIGVKVSVFFAKCSEVKVNRNISSKVKYRYPKKRLKYSNEVFLLRYYTTLLFFEHFLKCLLKWVLTDFGRPA